MGYTQAQEMAHYTHNGLSIEAALRYHLTVNHFPPVPVEMVPVAKRAISKAFLGQWDKQVRLPKGTTYRGKSLVPVGEIIGALHLEPWLEVDEEEKEKE